MFRRTTRFEHAAGITLLELLIVMVIMLMITAAAIPIIAPATRNRQMREATRLVSAYLGAARARAVQTGRPAGVMIERFNPSPLNGGAFALQMSQIEMPPPYSGDMVGAKAIVAITAPGANEGENASRTESQDAFNARFNGTTHTRSAVWFTAEVDTSVFNPAMVKVGDQIQFGGQGYRYTIWGPDISPVDGVIDNTGGTVRLDIAYEYPDGRPYTKVVEPLPMPPQLVDYVSFPWANVAPLPTPQAVTYQVFRQPVRTSTQPLILPDGIVVDLSLSGVGSGLFNVRDYNVPRGPNVPPPIVTFDPQIIFSPSGRLDYVTLDGGTLARPTDPVFLLLGRRELMYDATASTPPIAKDLVFRNLSAVPDPDPTSIMTPAENFWVTIGYQTGLVTVSEVAPHVQDYDNALGITTPALTNQRDVINQALFGNLNAGVGAMFGGARDFARQSQSVGGR